MSKSELVSERLKLRLIELSDLNDIHALHSLPETDEFNTLGIPENLEVTKSVIEPWIVDNEQKKNFTFAVELTKGGTFIGLISLKAINERYRRAEVWYKLHRDFWNKGFGTEALSRILDFAFEELQLHRIEAGCAVDNIGSVKVLEKVGMLREGRKRKVLPLKSGWSDNFEYAILESDERPHNE